MAVENPNFILRGTRNFAEKTLPWSAGGLGLGLFVTKLSFLVAPFAGWTLANFAIISFVSKSKVPQAAQ